MRSRSDLKVVLVVPASNTTMEAELRGYWPEVAEIYRVGVPRPARPMVAQELPEYRANTLRMVAPLSARKPDIVLYGCTTAGFLAGPDGDDEVCAALADAAGAPAVTAAGSMVKALRHSGVQRPAIVTPYLDASNESLKRFLAAMDIRVAALESFRLARIEDYDQVALAQVRDLALATARSADADGVFVACTQLRTLGILDELRQALEKPAWGAIQATVWAGRRALGLDDATHRNM